jgi:hypothetical protein
MHFTMRNWQKINRLVSEWLFTLAKRRQFYTLRLQESARKLWREQTPSFAIAGITVGVNRISLEQMLSKSLLDMPQTSPERRTMRRFDMRLPAVVRLEGANEFHTETQNVSARGVFLYLDRAVAPGSQLEVTLTFPPHITLTDAVRVRFTARVIRVESPLPSLRIGTAAMIENYEFLRSGGGGDFLSALQQEWKAAN